MIPMLMVMSDMDLSHDELGLVELILVGLILLGLSHVVLVRSMQQVPLVGIVLVLATRVRLVSLGRFWPQG
jgi:hypothetical protein